MRKGKIIIIVSIIILILAIIISVINIHDENNKLIDLNQITTDSEYENIVYDEVEDIWQDEVLGILTIEKINLKATVREGTDSNILSKYIGHIEETATYDGNIGLART